MCHREPRGAPGVLCRGQDHHVTRGLTRVGACWTVQGTRTTSFGSRRRRFSGSSSMRLSSRVPLPARDTDTPWRPWAATCSFSEGGRTQVRRHAVLAGHRLGSCQISHRRLFRALLLCCVCAAAWCRAGVPCLSVPGSGGDTVSQYLYPVTVSRTGHTNEHVHNVSSRDTWCTGCAV
jgi:hypothetical protein